MGSLNDDPNRPMLHRGKPAGATTGGGDDLPKLAGLPGDVDLRQLVAVSDAVNHPPHDFSRPWDDDAEHQAILGKMQDAARAALTAYEAANGLAPTNAAPQAPAPAARTAATHTTAARRTAPRRRQRPRLLRPSRCWTRSWMATR